jgi:hypothetical protein
MTFVVKVSLNCHSMLTGRPYKVGSRMSPADGAMSRQNSTQR